MFCHVPGSCADGCRRFKGLLHGPGRRLGGTLIRAYPARAGARVCAGAVRAPDCPRTRARDASPARRPVGGAKVGHGVLSPSVLRRAHRSCRHGAGLRLLCSRPARRVCARRGTRPADAVPVDCFRFYVRFLFWQYLPRITSLWGNFFLFRGQPSEINGKKYWNTPFVSSRPRLSIPAHRRGGPRLREGRRAVSSPATTG